MGELSGCGKLIKYSIFLVNFVIFIVGLVVLGLGIWTLVDKHNVREVLGDSNYDTSAKLLLSIGGIVAFISFLGCCGAIKEVKCLLMSFFVIMLVFTIVIVVGVVFATKLKDQGKDILEKGLKESMKEYDQDKEMQESWDAIQKEFKCCGLEDESEWNTTIPESCNCINKNDTDVCNKNGHWKKGCMDEIVDVVIKYAKPLIIAGIFLAIIIVLAMIFSCSLFMMI